MTDKQDYKGAEMPRREAIPLIGGFGLLVYGAFNALSSEAHAFKNPLKTNLFKKKKEAEIKMVSLDELFKSQLNPVSRCLEYNGSKNISGISEKVYEFGYDLAQQEYSQDRSHCKDYQFKMLANEIGLTDEGIREMVVLYAKTYLPSHIGNIKANGLDDIKESDFEVLKDSDGKVMDILYHGRNSYINKHLIRIRPDHFIMVPGSDIYLPESILATEKLNELRSKGYKIKEEEKKKKKKKEKKTEGSRRDFFDNIFGDVKRTFGIGNESGKPQ